MYHEPTSELQPADRDISRALNSLKEEIEAVDWYHQRVVTATDPGLRDILAHNRDEEIEHACMVIEWLRRVMPAFDEELRTYLFTDVPVTEVEGAATEGEGNAAAPTGGKARSLGIGSLR